MLDGKRGATFLDMEKHANHMTQGCMDCENLFVISTEKISIKIIAVDLIVYILVFLNLFLSNQNGFTPKICLNLNFFFKQKCSESSFWKDHNFMDLKLLNQT